MVQKFEKNPVVIEAVQFDGTNFEEIKKFTDGGVYWIPMEGKPAECLYVKTLEGDMKASPNDWIIKGISGEFYPCKPDIFAKTYHSV